MKDPQGIAAKLARETGAPSLTTVIPPGVLPGGGAEKAKRSKYRNKPTIYNGLRFDSKAEADYAELLDEEMALTPGMFWVRQPTFHLGVPENVYKSDFIVYRGDAGPRPIEVVDVKGVRTAKFNRDVKLWCAYGPCPLVIATRKGRKWATEVVMPERRGS